MIFINLFGLGPVRLGSRVAKPVCISSTNGVVPANTSLSCKNTQFLIANNNCFFHRLTIYLLSNSSFSPNSTFLIISLVYQLKSASTIRFRPALLHRGQMLFHRRISYYCVHFSTSSCIPSTSCSSWSSSRCFLHRTLIRATWFISSTVFILIAVLNL